MGKYSYSLFDDDNEVNWNILTTIQREVVKLKHAASYIAK